MGATDENLGELLGRYYVAEKFSSDAKDRAQKIVYAIEGAFLMNLPTVDWMDNTTRKAALQKLEMVSNLIGYPDEWTDYTSLCFTESYFDNVLATTRFAVANNLDLLFKDVNPLLWE